MSQIINKLNYNFNPKVLLIIFSTLIGHLFAQDTNLHSSQIYTKEHRYSQERLLDCLRLGVGIQRTLMVELGYTKMLYRSSCTGFFSKMYYTSIEYLPQTPNFKHQVGVKLGYEINISLLNLGLETKYQTDFTTQNMIFRPKIGVGISFINLIYSYQLFSTQQFPLDTKHQLSLSINLSFKN